MRKATEIRSRNIYFLREIKLNLNFVVVKRIVQNIIFDSPVYSQAKCQFFVLKVFQRELFQSMSGFGENPINMFGFHQTLTRSRKAFLKRNFVQKSSILLENRLVNRDLYFVQFASRRQNKFKNNFCRKNFCFLRSSQSPCAFVQFCTILYNLFSWGN